jgi:TRAP-type C4-dicarboxylate transport system permease small subunit
MAAPETLRDGGLRALLSHADQALCKVEAGCAILAGAAALTTMVLVSADALMRHLFSAPLTWQLVLTEDYLLVALLLLAMPWGYRSGGFIRLDMLVNTLPAFLSIALLRVGLLLSGLYVAKLATLSAAYALKAWQRADVVMGVIDWPVWLSWVWLPVGLGLLALRLLLDAVSPLRAQAETHA